MTKTEVKGKVENAYGKPLHELKRKDKEGNELPPIAKGDSLAYSTTVELYDSIEEVKAANDLPKDKDIVDWRNAKIKANARQKAMQVAQDAAFLVEPTIETDDVLRLKKMYELFLSNVPAASRDTDEAKQNARDLASNALGIAWPTA